MEKFKTVKTIFLAVLVVLGSASFASCSDDDDDTNPIVGTWKQTASTSEYFIDGESQGDPSENIVDDNNYQQFVFKADDSFSSVYVEEDYDDENGSGTYTTKDTTLSLLWVDDSESDDYTYTISGSTLILISTEEYTANGIDHVYEHVDTYTKQ